MPEEPDLSDGESGETALPEIIGKPDIRPDRDLVTYKDFLGRQVKDPARMSPDLREVAKAKYAKVHEELDQKAGEIEEVFATEIPEGEIRAKAREEQARIDDEEIRIIPERVKQAREKAQDTLEVCTKIHKSLYSKRRLSEAEKKEFSDAWAELFILDKEIELALETHQEIANASGISELLDKIDARVSTIERIVHMFNENVRAYMEDKREIRCNEFNRDFAADLVIPVLSAHGFVCPRNDKEQAVERTYDKYIYFFTHGKETIEVRYRFTPELAIPEYFSATLELFIAYEGSKGRRLIGRPRQDENVATEIAKELTARLSEMAMFGHRVAVKMFSNDGYVEPGSYIYPDVYGDTHLYPPKPSRHTYTARLGIEETKQK